MAKITFKGSPVHTSGEMPKVGSKAPDFVLTDGDLNDYTLEKFAGKRVLISTVISLDTGVCSLSAKKFNEAARKNPDIVILFVSADLPFAQKRVCTEGHLENILPLSMMRSKDFASDYGVLLVDGPLAGLATRAIITLDESGKVLYTELVEEIAEEPLYDKALETILKR